MAAKKNTENKKELVDWLALILASVGALNWGSIGVLNVNFVEKLLPARQLHEIVYILVGLSGLYLLWAALGKK